MNREKILLAMSGGTDSSVAAIMLLEQGYELIGVTMRMCDTAQFKDVEEVPGYITDAKALADKLCFEHHVVDVREKFNDSVINNFIGEYMSGKTPNPCVLCNVEIKWDYLIKIADKLNCSRIATGHYAKISEKKGRYFITKAKDRKKDQSYFLWGLSQQVLAKAMFPLGEFFKEEIREYADSKGFTSIAKRKDSMEICFIEDNEYRSFLRRKVKDIGSVPGEGDFIFKDGTKVGTHKGIPFYTIGQRKGLGIALGKPVYVIDIISDTNTIILGYKEDLKSKIVWVKDFNMMKYKDIKDGMNVSVKIRYRDEGSLGSIYNEGEYIKLEMFSDVSAVTPGQSAVFYEGDDIVGGGIITKIKK